MYRVGERDFEQEEFMKGDSNLYGFHGKQC